MYKIDLVCNQSYHWQQQWPMWLFCCEFARVFGVFVASLAWLWLVNTKQETNNTVNKNISCKKCNSQNVSDINKDNTMGQQCCNVTDDAFAKDFGGAPVN